MQRSADKAAWVRFLREAGFDDKVARSWAALARPNIRLLTGDGAETDTLTLGSSKLGGEPDLVRGTVWPERSAYSYTHGRRASERTEVAPLDFLGQINLAEVAKIGCDLTLPDSGLLSFFYDGELQPWGFDPADAPGFRVIYSPAGSDLARLTHPDGARAVLPLRLEGGESLPDWAWLLDSDSDVIGEDDDAFHAVLDQLDDVRLFEMSYTGHAFGGWAALIQNPMELECQLASNGIFVGGPEGYAEPRARALEAGAADWRLLLQLDSEDELGWMWGDEGTLYYWSRKQDMAAARFDRAWTVLQCT